MEYFGPEDYFEDDEGYPQELETIIDLQNDISKAMTSALNRFGQRGTVSCDLMLRTPDGYDAHVFEFSREITDKGTNLVRATGKCVALIGTSGEGEIKKSLLDLELDDGKHIYFVLGTEHDIGVYWIERIVAEEALEWTFTDFFAKNTRLPDESRINHQYEILKKYVTALDLIYFADGQESPPHKQS